MMQWEMMEDGLLGSSMGDVYPVITFDGRQQQTDESAGHSGNPQRNITM